MVKNWWHYGYQPFILTYFSYSYSYWLLLDVAFTCEFIRKNFINESKLIVLINAVRSIVHASLWSMRKLLWVFKALWKVRCSLQLLRHKGQDVSNCAILLSLPYSYSFIKIVLVNKDSNWMPEYTRLWLL